MVGRRRPKAVSVLSHSLAFTDADGRELAGSSGSVNTAASDVGAIRSLRTSMSTGTVYLSFLIRCRNVSGPESYGGLSIFDNSGEKFFLGEPYGSTNSLLAAVAGGSGYILQGTDATKVNFVVLRIDFDQGTAAGNEKLTIYINPRLAAEAGNPAFVLGNVSSFNLSRIRLQSGGGSPVQVAEFDEIRVGSTFGSVAPPNEDPDGDGLLSSEELDLATNPENFDTNGDGFGDGEAFAAGLDLRGHFGAAIQLVQRISRTNPSRFSLYPQENLEAQRQAGREDVSSNPRAYGLYTPQSIMDLRMGGTIAAKSGDSVKFVVQPQATTDLMSRPFTNAGPAVTNILQLPGDKSFLRIQARP
jgi:hypothetical protein